MTDAIDKERNTFHFERLLTSSPDDVFDSWTDPDEVTAWWDPSGVPLVSCAIDLRVGGAFRFETRGHAPPFEGTYSVVDRPHQLEFVAMGAQGSVRLEKQGTGTLMKVAIACPSRELFETYVKLGVVVGTGQTLDNLVRRVGARRKPSAEGTLRAP